MSLPEYELVEYNYLTSAPLDELLHQCGLEVKKAINFSNIEKLGDLANKIDRLSNMVHLSEIMIKANIPSSSLEVCKSAGLPIKSAALLTLSEYSKLSQDKIIDIIKNTRVTSEVLWNQFVPDADNVSEEALDGFYNICGNYRLFFSRYYTSMNTTLASSLRGFIALVAQGMGGKYFDFGGGIGNLTAAVSKLGHNDVYLVETDEKQLDFVKWKDKECGITNINYVSSNEIEEFFNMKEQFQLVQQLNC